MATAIERIFARIDALGSSDPRSAEQMTSIAADIDALTAEEMRTAINARGTVVDIAQIRAGITFFSAVVRAWNRLAETLDGARQPAPKPNDGPIVWELVIADATVEFDPTFERARNADGVTAFLIEDMRRRDRLGRERYGTPLQPNNGRDPLRDWYEEILDGCAYGRQALEEGRTEAEEGYIAALNLAFDLRLMMVRRDAVKGG